MRFPSSTSTSLVVLIAIASTPFGNAEDITTKTKNQESDMARDGEVIPNYHRRFRGRFHGRNVRGKSGKHAVHMCHGIDVQDLRLCNDYAAANADNLFSYGDKDIPNGAEAMSGIPKLSDELAVHVDVGSKERRGSTQFLHTLKAVGKHEFLGGYTFGDLGYDNPGHGGVNNFDIFSLKEPMKLSAFGSFYVRNNDATKPCLDTTSTVGCVWSCSASTNLPDAWNQPWWSYPKDSDGLTILESKNQVSQVCWNQTMLQAIQCEFDVGTHIMVGMGSWRSTGDSIQDVCDDGEWDDVQKVISEDVYQYLIPMMYPKSDLSDVKVNSCFVCPANKDDVGKTFDNLADCWEVPTANPCA